MPIQSLVEKLNLIGKEGFFFFAQRDWPQKAGLSKRVEESLTELQPAAFFCVNNEPLVLFFDNVSDSHTIERKCWNFNQSPVIFISDGNSERILNGFKFLKGTGLEILSSDVGDFEYFKLITGETWENYKESFDSANRVDRRLLANIDTARTLLLQGGYIPAKTINFLIGRVIFTRYLIDRQVELVKYGIISKEDFYTILSATSTTYSFFEQLMMDFNGNLFPLNYDIDGQIVKEKHLITDEHLAIIINLLKGDELSTGQSSLFDIYDFAIIPIEFVSNVYEKFIGKSEQARQGAYYTPLFLVDYIQKDTVIKYFDQYPDTFSCKVLDPACGSGIFLVETLRQIIYQYERNNNELTGERNSEAYKQALKQLLTENIFGIDKDENAINVAIFSLYITLLEYLQPSSIVNFQFPCLIDTNFFVGDFFNQSAGFNGIIKANDYQFILGNPPWASKHPEEKQLFELYTEKREKEESFLIKLSNREIAQAFLIRVSDFSFKECAFIITSKILYNIQAKTYRSYFIHKFLVRKLFELSSVRKQIFDRSNDKAVAPASIIFFSKAENALNIRKNIVTHISLKPNLFFETFKLLVIEKYDYKEVRQGLLIDNDWLWKVLVYGNILDFHFIKRLKENLSVQDYLNDDTKFIYGKGVCINGGDENQITEHQTIQYAIDSKKRGLEPYRIKYADNFLKVLPFVHRPRNINLYRAPMLLVGKGVTGDFKAKAALSDVDVIFTDAITSIKSLADNTDFLNFLLALFNSDLFSYFLIQTNSSIGIEREQTHDKEDKFSMPVIYKGPDPSLSELLRDLKTAIIAFDKSVFYDAEKQQLERSILSIRDKINQQLYLLYNLTQQEHALISYAVDIVIPSLGSKNSGRKISPDKAFLSKYAAVFIRHFNNIYNIAGNYFEVEIFESKYAVGMYFKVIAIPSTHQDQIFWNAATFEKLLSIFATLSYANISMNLFMQKDLKGFEADGFYIIKPNEKKCWHEAVAYLDLGEIIDAIHQTRP